MQAGFGECTCHMSRCWHVSLSITVHVLVYVCACWVCPWACVILCVCSQLGCHWAYMCVISHSLLCTCHCVCVRLLSGTGCLCLHLSARVLVCLCVCVRVAVPMCCYVCVCPGAATSNSCRASQGQPSAPLAAVFYHHLPRKGAQEDGDK